MMEDENSSIDELAILLSIRFFISEIGITDFNEQIIITPRNYRLKFKVSNSFERHYAIIGVGTVIDDYPLYADAMNEKGLCFAGLSFKGNAKYYPIDLKKDNYAPYELPLYILGTCDDIKMVKERWKNDD